MYLLYNHCVKTNFKNFIGIANPEENTPNMWNQHQLHQGETQSQTHHYIFMCLIAYKMHYICLFAHNYHMRDSFLDTLGSSLLEPRRVSRSLLCVSKNCIMHSLEAHKQQYSISLTKATQHKHITYFMRHCTTALCNTFHWTLYSSYSTFSNHNLLDTTQ